MVILTMNYTVAVTCEAGSSFAMSTSELSALLNVFHGTH